MQILNELQSHVIIIVNVPFLNIVRTTYVYTDKILKRDDNQCLPHEYCKENKCVFYNPYPIVIPQN